MICGPGARLCPMVISVADLVVRHLRQAGVGFVFGVPGGGSNLDLVAAAGRAGLPFVLTATETAAAIAAVAQAEISGRPGVCLTTLGPGVTSVVNGVACAWLDRAPLLVFTDSHPAATGGVFEHQRVDHRALLAPVTKWSARLSPENADAVVREAIDRAMTEPRGPVHIECPGDVLSAPVVTPDGTRRRVETEDVGLVLLDVGRVLLDPASLARSLLARANKPLLIVGLGARRPLDAEAIATLCARRGLPAMVTYKAKGVVPDGAPHFAGVFTNGVLERPLVAEADLLLGIGLDPVELIPRPWTYDAPIVYIGPASVDDHHVPFAAQLVADIPSGLQLAGDLLSKSAWDLDAVHHALVEQRQRLCPASKRLAPHRVVQIAAATRARVTVDAGAHMFPATLLWPVAEPNGMLISNGLSTMGFALPAAIGAALVEREAATGTGGGHGRPVIALTGDGGLLMCIGELLTAVRERLHVIVIVFADASLSLIDIKQQRRRLASAGVALGAIDWCALAASMGAVAHCARTEEELERALARGLAAPGPTVIEARIDPGTYAETLHTIRG
jgi:acetolactate synthase I/II/III large subunit